MKSFFEFYHALNESKMGDTVEILSKLADQLETIREKVNTGVLDLSRATKTYDRSMLAKFAHKLAKAAAGAPNLEALDFVGKKAKDFIKILATGETAADPEDHSFLSSKESAPEEKGGFEPFADGNKMSGLLSQLKNAIKDRMSDLWREDPEHDEYKANTDKGYTSFLQSGQGPIRRIQKRYGPRKGNITTDRIFPTTTDKFIN